MSDFVSCLKRYCELTAHSTLLNAQHLASKVSDPQAGGRREQLEVVALVRDGSRAEAVGKEARAGGTPRALPADRGRPGARGTDGLELLAEGSVKSSSKLQTASCLVKECSGPRRGRSRPLGAPKKAESLPPAPISRQDIQR